MKASWLLALIQWIFGKKPAPTPPPAPVPAPAPTPIPTPLPPKPDPDLPRKMLYDKAVASLGTDASPSDQAPDEYGCAETVSNILHRAFSDFPEEILSTAVLYTRLRSHPKFKIVTNFDYGDVIISPTGMGKTGAVANGHVGIVGKNCIMSNSSGTGKFLENYTLSTWIAYFRTRGGYPIYFFRRVEL